MRWSGIGAAVATVVVAGALVLAGPGAAMADSYPDVPSPVKGIPATGADAVQGDDLALWDMEMRTGGSLLTKMSPLQRGNTVLAAGSVGFVIGATGARIVYAITGQSWDAAMCTVPPIVREGYALASVGIGGSSGACATKITSPNSDQVTQWSSISSGGFTMAYKGSFQYTGSNATVYCYSTTSDPQQLVNLRLVGPGGVVYGGGGYAGGQPVCTPYVSGANFNLPNGPAWSLVNATTGATVSAMTASSPNPQRDGRCVAMLHDGTQAVGTMFQYSETSGVPLTSFQNSCNGFSMGFGGGHGGIDSMQLQTRTPAGSTNAWSTTVNSPLPSWQRDLATTYPDCYTAGASCSLTLEKVKGLTVDHCFTDDPTACADWATETQQGTVATTSDGWEYKCKYGSHEVDLTKCLIYASAFGTQAAPGTLTDPATGKPLDTGQGTDTTTGTGNPGNSIDPGTDVGTSNKQCMDQWFSTPNPIDWVMTPIKCALRWAFVPRAEVVETDQAEMQDAWKDTMPGKLPGVVATAIVVPSGGGGCQGPHVAFTVPWSFHAGTSWGYDGYPLSACSEPMATTAGFARTIGAAILIYFTGLGIIRRASSIVHSPGLGGGPS